MADTHEEQLLSDLLLDLRRADESSTAATMEPRVLAAWDRLQQQPVSRLGWKTYVTCALAASLVAAFALSARRSDVPDIPQVAAAPRLDLVARNAKPIAPTQSAITQSPIAQSPIAEPITQSPIAQSPIEFVSVAPLSDPELPRSFQIVRVQAPRVSLGAFTSPLQHPNEIVEADVLLTEDGMVRAIHLSTKGSVYPWRPR